MSALSPLSIAREIFPRTKRDTLEYLIWNRTGFPCFWPARYRSWQTALRDQLRRFKRAADALRPGELLCEYCNAKATHRGRAYTLCQRHFVLLDAEG